MAEHRWPFAIEEMRKLPGQAMRFTTPQCVDLGGWCVVGSNNAAVLWTGDKLQRQRKS